MKKAAPFRRFALRLMVLQLSCVFAAQAADDSDAAAIADVPFEQLLHTEIVTADKLAKQISDAPSAVSIVTARDIRDYGFRTLSDILDSMRGLSMSHNSSRGYLSGRGYANAGSPSGRLTLLIDGYRATDGFFARTYFGSDGLLDVDLIERVEYIPGNGSSSYGDSAFLGVVNIVTKKGRDIDGTQVATEFGSHRWRQNRVTFGRQFENGLDLVFSASGMESDGRRPKQSIVFADVDRVEQHSNRRLFLKAAYKGWTFESAWATREAALPINLGLKEPDVNSFGRLKYDGELSEHLKTTLDFYYGHYRSKDMDFDPEDLPEWREEFAANWRGVDAKLVGTWFDRHTLVFGAEYRDDFKQTDRAYHGDTLDSTWFLGSRRTQSLYAYDDFSLASNLQLNFGGRWDARNNGSKTFSPRGALVYSPVDGTTFKLSTGIAHRQQTPWSESWAADSLVEKVTTKELVWEQMLGPKTRLVSSLYRYRIDNFIYYLSLGWIDGNYGPKASKGAEVELEHLWNNGVRLRASYAYQNTWFPYGMFRPDGIFSAKHPANMAHHNAKFNLSAPLAGDSLRVGLSARYLGRRLQNDWTTYERGFLVSDLTLTGKWSNWTAAFSIRNLGDASYNEVNEPGVTAQMLYPADRRNFWFQLGYEFK